MKNNTRIKTNPNGIKQLAREISATMQSQGLNVVCPHCGKVVIVYETPTKCPECDQQFEVALKY